MHHRLEWSSDGDFVVAQAFEAAKQLPSSRKKKIGIILFGDRIPNLMICAY
jgi:hypothetical protein